MSERTFRAETASDRAQVANLLDAAFGRADEARLVAALHAAGAVVLSLVCDEHDSSLAGHVMFSRLAIEADSKRVALRATALAPVAVHPSRQRRGLGAMLIRAGLDRLRRQGDDVVFVLGDPGYYGRFGFERALAARFECPWSGPCFMGLALRSLNEGGFNGRIVYPTPFNSLA